jgi:hypothetical protein
MRDQTVIYNCRTADGEWFWVADIDGFTDFATYGTVLSTDVIDAWSLTPYVSRPVYFDAMRYYPVDMPMLRSAHEPES